MFLLKVLSMTVTLIFCSAITLAQETSLDLRKDGRVVTGDRKDFFLRKVATNEFKVTDYLRNKFKSSDVSAIVIPPGMTEGRYLIGVVLGGGTLPDDWPVSEEEFKLLRTFAINKRLAKAEAATRGVRDGLASRSSAMVNLNTAELQSLMAENSSESEVAVAYAGYLLQSVDKAAQIATLSDIVTKYREAEAKTVRNPDYTYAIIEYPAKKEVKINLTPVTIQNATGVATILRDDDGTRIILNFTNVPADVTAVNLYAVDDKGVVTLLGPVAISNGAGTFTGTTPLSRFMIVASPEPTLTAYDANTKVFFRSAVPEGMAVIPLTSASGEKVSATTAPTGSTTVVTPVGTTVATTYTAPMLNIPAYKKGDDTKIKVDFTGALTGARANVFITPRKDGPTEVKFRLDEMKEAPAGQKFVLWAVSPDNQFVKLGQVVNAPGRNEAEIKSETTLQDFGLVLTMEAADDDKPTGPAVAHIHIVP